MNVRIPTQNRNQTRAILAICQDPNTTSRTFLIHFIRSQEAFAKTHSRHTLWVTERIR
ncbi:hypothetical protein F2P79_009254 [Pimephales promelas]|nr:hypothetical protein F2P79_009254 [Pimephales promelas]